ncbi:hypothetical protein GCM10010532_075730 [Dactylosporangium siamense]|uniref:Uncharacterized protein n=1 Tax=Dactylosporangium siamense TaxID=685454 RepID=A0A919PSV6_9ACTN|nr:hypothetical protein Dsi01nite_058660 [Dactylosporangium siamense]
MRAAKEAVTSRPAPNGASGTCGAGMRGGLRERTEQADMCGRPEQAVTEQAGPERRGRHE